MCKEVPEGGAEVLQVVFIEIVPYLIDRSLEGLDIQVVDFAGLPSNVRPGG